MDNELKDIKDVLEQLPQEPKCFNMMIPINGHPMQGDIKCIGGTGCTDWDILQAAWTIELSVIDTLFKKGLSKERIMEQISLLNYYRRMTLGYAVGGMSEDKDFMDCMMEIGMIQEANKNEAAPINTQDVQLIMPKKK